MFLRLLLLLASLAGISRAAAPAPLPTISNAEQADRVYQEGCDLISPYMRLVGVEAKPVDAEGKANLLRGLALLKVVADYAPANWSAHWVRGKGFQVLGEALAACAAFKQAFDLPSENADMAREYTFECLKLGSGAEGLRAAKQAVKLRPAEAGLQANLALACLVAGDAPAALQAANEALRLDPSDTISQNLKRIIQEVLDGKRPVPKKLGDIKG